MNTSVKSLGSYLLVASLLSIGGTVCSAENNFGYCAIPACAETAKENIILSMIGLGDAKLNWWDCRAQNDCSDLSSSIGSLQMTEADCTSAKLESLKKDIGSYSTKLLEVLQKVDPQMTTVANTPAINGLENDLIQHFVKCETAGYFKPDTNACVTPTCEKALEQIAKLEVNEAGCVKGLDAVTPSQYAHYDFAFEEGLIKSKIEAFKEKCIAGNLLPAATVFGRAVLQKDLEFAMQCEQLKTDIEKQTDSANVTQEGCTLDLYNKLYGQVDTLKADLQKLDTISLPATDDKSSHTNILNDLNRRIDVHFVQCSDKNFFPPDTSKCFSNECKETQAIIEAFKVDEVQCTDDPRILDVKVKYQYEYKVIDNLLEVYKQKCIDGNILPAATFYDRAVLKKDIPLAEQCESMDKSLNDQVKSLEVNTEECKTPLFHELHQKVSRLKDELKKFDAVSKPTYQFTRPWVEDLTESLDREINNHFVECERENLFPDDTSKCLTTGCEEAKAKIEAFQINKQECEDGPRTVSAQSSFTFEQNLVEKWLKEYEEKCKLGDGLPYAIVNMKAVYKSEYDADKKALQEKIDSMGQNGEIGKYGNVKLIPYKDLVAKINSLKHTKEDCNYDNSLHPIDMNTLDYMDVYRDSGLGTPKEFDDLLEKFRKFQSECVLNPPEE